MQDGYYISAYMYIDALSYLTNRLHNGSFTLGHDQNISLWRKTGRRVELIHYWELERISREKHHHRSFFDIDSALGLINYLLLPYGISLNDVQEIWGIPQLAASQDSCSFLDDVDLPFHIIAHLFSSIYMKSSVFYNDNIVAMAVDGGPYYSVKTSQRGLWYAGCVVRKGELNIRAIESPGMLWVAAKDLFRLEEGTLMALASACESGVLIDDEDPIIHGPRFFGPDAVLIADSTVHRVVGCVNELVRVGRFSGFEHKFSYQENMVSMAMKIITKISLNIMVRNIDLLLREFHIDPKDSYLSLSGGYALNCPTNSYLMEKFSFKELLSSPLVNDGGQSLGIALHTFYRKLREQTFEFTFPGAYLGDPDERLLSDLEENYRYFMGDISDLDLDRAVLDLQEGPVVWFNGRSEVGPRALGNRSILGDPRTVATKSTLNTIKDRQWWRPVAPVVLESQIDSWFNNPRISPYMLETFTIRADRLHLVPAISHLDNSARIQTINENTNPNLFHLLLRFFQETGVPMLCNTSLNDKGEPIINTLPEAINFCLRKRLPVAYLNGKRVKFKNHAEYQITYPMGRLGHYSFDPDKEVESFWSQLNPYGLSHECIQIALDDVDIRSKYALQNSKDASIVEILGMLRGIAKQKRLIRLSQHPWPSVAPHDSPNPGEEGVISPQDRSYLARTYDWIGSELRRLVSLGVPHAAPEAQALAKVRYDLLLRLLPGDPEVEWGLREWWFNYNSVPIDQRPPGMTLHTKEEVEYLEQALVTYVQTIRK